MSTRSNIAYEEDGAVHLIHCHMDGYLDQTGRVLFDHYNSFEKAKELVDLGAISFLETTVALNRERSRCLHNRKPEFYRSIRSYMYHVDAQEIEYIYMWDKNMWWIARSISINTWRAWHHEQNEQGYHQFVCYHNQFESLGSELAHWDYDNPTDEQGAYV